MLTILWYCFQITLHSLSLRCTKARKENAKTRTTRLCNTVMKEIYNRLVKEISYSCCIHTGIEFHIDIN